METARIPIERRPLGERRLVEWGGMVLIVVAVSAILWHYGQQVRALAERAAVQNTLGALRTTLILDQVRYALPSVSGKVADHARPAAVPNPFVLLQNPVGNYAGEVIAAQMDSVPGGRWVFDGRCGCVGYKPQYLISLDAPAGAQVLWFRVAMDQGTPYLQPSQTYVWSGQVLN